MKWNDKVEINFSDGGSFIAGESIYSKLIAIILTFFAKITKFTTKDEMHIEWKMIQQYLMLCLKCS